MCSTLSHNITAPCLQAPCLGGCEPGEVEEGTGWDIFDDERQAQGRPWEAAGAGGISGGDCQLRPAWKICTKPPSVQLESLTAETKMSIKEKHLRFLWGACHPQGDGNTSLGRIHFHCLPERYIHRLPWARPGADQRKSAWSGTGLSTQMCLDGHRRSYYSSQELLVILSSTWRYGCAVSCRNFLPFSPVQT